MPLGKFSDLHLVKEEMMSRRMLASPLKCLPNPRRKLKQTSLEISFLLSVAYISLEHWFFIPPFFFNNTFQRRRSTMSVLTACSC
jgi:hypothetical protein